MAVHHQQRQPVVGGAFGKGHGQDDYANQQQLGIAPDRLAFAFMARRFRRIFAGAFRNRANGDSNGGDGHQRRQQDVRRGGQAEAGYRHANPGADERAEAVETMHHWQDGFIHFAFNGGAFDVNRHFR
ncbi:Uncharacterised protein [Klebsiella pneumoniae]|nr:Uncharacterised protein [Klebsiella pneumoniae]